MDLALGDLPPGLVEHILYRENQGLADFLKSVEEKAPSAVAASREDAKVNEGMYDSLGDGIYDSPEGLRIRLDGVAEDDRGPFDTAREAVLASLPDIHTFSGPEYHSTVDDILRMEPSEEVKAAIAELEARQEAKHSASPGM